MITEPGLRFVFTASYAAAGLLWLRRGFRHGPATARVSNALHLVMCAGMILMACPAGDTPARAPQVLLFSLAAVWFVSLIVFTAARLRRKLAAPDSSSGDSRSR